jgi:hypothetical protein
MAKTKKTRKKKTRKKTREKHAASKEKLPSGLVLNKQTVRTIKVQGRPVKLESNTPD